MVAPARARVDIGDGVRALCLLRTFSPPSGDGDGGTGRGRRFGARAAGSGPKAAGSDLAAAGGCGGDRVHAG